MRSVNDDSRVEETKTVRLPKGTAAKVRAATGQPFSTIVRWMILQLLERAAQGEDVRERMRETVQRSINESLAGESSDRTDS